MNDEEIIETLKTIANDGTIKYYYNDKTIENINNAINLIFKQQKEIEYFKKQIPQDKIFYYSEKDYISKDKIKELIEEKAMTDTYNFKTIAVKDIEELLGE